MPVFLAVALAGAVGTSARYGLDLLFSRDAHRIPWVSAYTTFSPLSLETYRLLDRGRVALAAAYALGSLAAGLAAVTAGVAAGRGF
jgi:fluoride ion exporter CrcB/FEX